MGSLSKQHSKLQCYSYSDVKADEDTVQNRRCKKLPHFHLSQDFWTDGWTRENLNSTPS